MDEFEHPVDEWYPLVFGGGDMGTMYVSIVQNIISHPEELPTDTELEYMCDSVSEDADIGLTTALTTLEEAGIITRLKQDSYTFWGLTDKGKQFVVDSNLYRASDVLKAVTEKTRRTADVEAAYNASRPDHPPTTREYLEQDTSESDAWGVALDNAYRTLRLSYDRVRDDTYKVELIEMDDETTLDSTTIPVTNVCDWVNDEYVVELGEPRREIEPDHMYELTIDENPPVVEIHATRNGKPISTLQKLHLSTDEPESSH